jgi:prepilin-type N-terminal cleavage/methylation domain-containing protein
MKSILKQEKGVTLLETLVALAILSVISVAFMSGLTTSTKATVIADEQTTAESLARNQMEYVKNYTYQTNATEYPIDPSLTVPDTWEVLSCTAEALHTPDDGLQEVTVTIQHNGETVFTMTGYKKN